MVTGNTFGNWVVFVARISYSEQARRNEKNSGGGATNPSWLADEEKFSFQIV